MNRMTRQERFLTALRVQTPDRVPLFDFLFQQPMGYENICFALYEDPGLLAAVFRISNDFFQEAARLSVAAGCVALWVSEDLGDSSRGFFKREHYREQVLPPFVELVDYVAGPMLLPSHETAGRVGRCVRRRGREGWLPLGVFRR